MALGANSYGDTGEIAALVERFANASKVFDTTTRPPLAMVEAYTDQVSGVVNTILANYGFTTLPITQAAAKLALDFFVNQEMAAIVEGMNGLGRFGPTTKQGGAKGRFAVIVEDVEEFVKMYAPGLERLGVPRSYSVTAGLGYKDTDESGAEIFPLFSRKDYGYAFTNFDSE